MNTAKQFIPITLRVDQLNALVIGGGAVATRKVLDIHHKFKSVHVIAPNISDEIKKLQHVICEYREYEKGDLEGVNVLYSAVNDPDVSEKIYTDLQQYPSIVSNFVDKPDYCDFYTPCMIQKDDLIISLSSGGKAPGLLPKLKKEILQTIDLDAWSEKVVQYEQKRRGDNDNL